MEEHLQGGRGIEKKMMEQDRLLIGAESNLRVDARVKMLEYVSILFSFLFPGLRNVLLEFI